MSFLKAEVMRRSKKKENKPNYVIMIKAFINECINHVTERLNQSVHIFSENKLNVNNCLH